MSNLVNFLVVNPCKYGFWDFPRLCDGIVAFFWQLFHGLLGLVYKVLGLFADLLNIAFYIFAGVELSSDKVAGSENMYAVEIVGEGRQNILDYFVLSKTMQKAYLWMALLGLLLVVIFTIYKIIKQDYFEKAGPRSKGPIFRNVAISCISFLLVIPIFWIIIHVSSLLAVAVMSNLGMDVNTFAGAKIFMLSWSDNGETFRLVNNMLQTEGADVTKAFNYMENMHPDAMFTLLADGEYVAYDDSIMNKLNRAPLNQGEWTGTISALYFNDNGNMVSVQPTFYWYIYLVGVFVGIKSLYTLVLAMIQRIFKLMGLFLVAPSPISQYVLDDGQKFKSWLAQSIQEGLRLVVACMSFAIYLIVLNLVQDINFVAAFQSAIDNANQSSANLNVNTDLLSYEREFIQSGFIPLSHTSSQVAQGISNVLQNPGAYIANGFYALVNAFFKILLIMGAGGAIIDLDQVLTPFISGGKSSLDAGQTGKSIDAPVQAVKSVAGAMIGGAIAGTAAQIATAKAARQGKSDGAAEAQKEQKEAKEAIDKPSGGGDGVRGPTSGDGGTDTHGEPKGDGEDRDVRTPERTEPTEPTDPTDPTDRDGKEEPHGFFGRTEAAWQAVKGGVSAVGRAIGKVGSKVIDGKTWLKNKMSKHFLGRAGIRLAKGATGLVKNTLGAAKGVVGGAIKAGASSAGKILATAAVGKGTVDSFMGARKQINEDSKKNVAKAYESGKASGYRSERRDQMFEANEQANKRGAAVETAAGELTAAVAAEEEKAGDLNKANVEAGKAKQVAEEAESALLEADENAKGPRRTDKSRKQKMEAATKSIKEAQKANAEIEESYGTKADIKKKIAEYESNGNTAAARAYKDQLETYEKNEKKIGKGRETMDSLTAEADKREKALRICAGGGNGLSKAGIRADMSYRDAMSNIDGKLASSDLSDEDRKHLESVKSALEEVGEATYNSDAASVARIENDSYNKASEDRTKAQAKYDEAHKKTTDARNNLSSKMSSYNKSVELAAKLDEASDKSAYGSQTSTRYKLGKNGELQQVSKKSTLSNAYRATESIGRKNTLKKLGSKTQGLKSTMDDAIKTANGIKGPKEYTYADILNARLKDNEDMISGAYTDFDDASTAERDRAMTIVTSSGVDARSALDATTGVIGATSDITASDAKNVAINATSAATAGFRIRSTSRRSEFSIRAMLDACMTDGVLDFAAIDAEKTRHRSRHVDAALDKLKADYLAHATSELSHFGEEKTTTTVGEFIDSYKTDGRYNFEAMKSDLEASISKGGSSTGLETRIGECAATQRKYDQTSAKLAAGRAAVDAIGTMHAHEVERVSANTTRLKAVNGDVSVLNQIISQVESGHSVTLSDSQRRMIGSAIGARGGIIRTNDPTKIVEYATQARDAKREEQVRLTKDSEDHARQSAALGKELETMMNSVMGNIGARTQQPANNNVVNNNTTINNNNETTSPEQRYWFSGNQQSSDMPAASGLNQSRNMADMYERIQVEGIKHMESMLEQMRIESRAVAQDVKSVKKTVEEISED